MSNQTTTRLPPGLELERETDHLLRLFPGSRAERQVEIDGKKLDILFTTSGHLLPSYRIAVECKDWARPLTRQQCAHIVAEYLPLLEKRSIDQFLLVTRNGVVPNGTKVFDERKLQHLTFSQLADRIFNPLPLIENTRRQYLESALNGTYVSQYCNAPDLAFASKNFSRLYNDFIDLAVDVGAYKLPLAISAWGRYSDIPGDEFSKLYSDADFESCYEQRRPQQRVDLTKLALSWIESDVVGDSLALLGSYGTGKSSFAKHLAFLLAERYQRNPLERIPFLIELKEFGSHQDIRGLVTHELINRHGVANGSFELFKSLNAAGRFVLILDGFDEMKQGMTTDSLLFNFNQLGSLSIGRSKVLLCGRPTLFETRAEQQRIMTGAYAMSDTRHTRYIQVEMAPFNADEACHFLELTSKSLDRSSAKRILNFSQSLRKMAARYHLYKRDLRRHESAVTKELLDLVSRPVHLPMLASVLPRREIRPETLTRSLLYTEFIDAIIEREMLKRRPEFTNVYDARSRRDFARQLAIEMGKNGESRSIQTSEIPRRLFEKFVVPGRSPESARRDLVSARFLERKGADLLFFPHKSFWEFLVADEIAIQIRSVDSPKTDDLGFRLTDEILAFVSDLLIEEDWLKLAGHVSHNTKVLVGWLGALGESQKILPDSVLGAWAESIPLLSYRIQQHIAFHAENCSKAYGASSSYRHLVFALLESPDDVTAVHAYRALAGVGTLLSPKDLRDKLGWHRFLRWMEHRWINDISADEGNELVRNGLVSCFLATLQQIALGK